MSTKQTSIIDQSAANSTIEQDHSMIGFFGIGVAINLVLIAAYLVWAYKQWNKNKHSHND